jgi:hypothetical protein
VLTTAGAALAAIAIVDIIFAVDSVPAILAITTDSYIVFAANAFALLGLRPLFFLVAELVERLYYLKTALAALLVFIGAKMALAQIVGKIGPEISLPIIIAILAAASWRRSCATGAPGPPGRPPRAPRRRRRRTSRTARSFPSRGPSAARSPPSPPHERGEGGERLVDPLVQRAPRVGDPGVEGGLHAGHADLRRQRGGQARPVLPRREPLGQQLLPAALLGQVARPEGGLGADDRGPPRDVLRVALQRVGERVPGARTTSSGGVPGAAASTASRMSAVCAGSSAKTTSSLSTK